MKNLIENKKILLDSLYDLYKDFKKTSLYIEGANSIVFGEGNPESKIIFIGEAPGQEEDFRARPFIGRSGKLLTEAIEATGFSRKDFFITNIVKCRPQNNRTPTNFEIEKGKTLILQHEISIINPKIIVPLGLSALKGLNSEISSMANFRGKEVFSSYGILFPIYHPAYVLRNQSIKNIFFNDIKNVIEKFKN